MKKIHKLLIVVLGGLLVSPIAYRAVCVANPDWAYLFITHKSLPKGVEAVKYGSRFTDNLFHRSHYWEFRHTDEGLRKFLATTKFVKNYDDAIWVRRTMELGLHKTIPKESIGRGYEWEKRRDDWLLVDHSGQRSYYEMN